MVHRASSLEDSNSDSHSGEASLRAENLSDVPEEGPWSPNPDPSSPYFTTSMATSTTNASSRISSSSKVRKSTTNSRTLGRSSADALPSRRTASSSSGTSLKEKPSKNYNVALQRIRSTPRLPHEKDADPVPATGMYWSKAPVYGAIPTRTMRGHTVTVVDSTAWVFGGCDDSKETSKDMYCFDVGP